MARTWISAGLGWKMASAICKSDIETYEFLIGAAETGALSTWAARHILPNREDREAPLPPDFWTCQISFTPDFREFTSTTKEGVASRAIDTFFDFFQVLDLIPPPQRPAAIQGVKVDEDPHWISATGLEKLAEAAGIVPGYRMKLVEFCAFGRLVARCSRARLKPANCPSAEPDTFIEWDIPPWFWRGLTATQLDAFDWAAGNFSDAVGQDRMARHIEIVDIYFHRDGLSALHLGDLSATGVEQHATQNRGRKPAYDWAKAINAIWGEIFRGDFKPKSQSEVEARFMAVLKRGDKEPGESTVRPYARPLWQEYNREA